MKKLILVFICVLLSEIISAQGYTVTGKVVDNSTNAALFSATVSINPVIDSSKISAISTDDNGSFSFTGLTPGAYKLNVFYIGYKKYSRTFQIKSKNIHLKEIKLESMPFQLEDILVEEKALRTQQKGDTTIYNAGSFKTNPDASTEDLIKKMPGIVVQDGKVQAHGEDLKKVLVDGQEFFGDDASMALKNIPSEAVDKIEVFDRQTDQAQFIGFNDGETEKTLNIVTKKGKNSGVFGKLYAGYGTDDRYSAGGNINYFKGSERISLLGMSNDINQQNFSYDDILGAIGSSSRPRGFGGGRRNREMSGSEFFVNNQSGINTTHSAGINYSNKWTNKAILNFSYFFNKSVNSTERNTDRYYFLTDSTTRTYTERYNAGGNNINHRVTGRLEYYIDSMNSFIYTPRFSFQTNKSSSVLSSKTFELSENENLLQNDNDNNNIGEGYNISNNFLFRHKFEKKGRTISLNLNAVNNKRDNENIQNSNLTDTIISNINYETRQITSNSLLSSYSANLAYTEPVGEYANLQINYSPSLSKNNMEKINYLPNSIPGVFHIIDTNISNKYIFDVTAQSAGASLRYNKEKTNISLRLNVEHDILEGKQTFPLSAVTKKTFIGLLPRASYQYKFSQTRNLRINYRTYFNLPDISQLQDVVDISNPLLLSTGNSQLSQEYTHNIFANFHNHNPKKATSLFTMLRFQYVDNHIVNGVFIPIEDTIINDYNVQKGTQLSKPVNLDGYWSLTSFATYGFPLSLIKSNFNFNGRLAYTNSPTLINNRKNISKIYSLRGGVFVGSNINEKIDFSVAYNINYNISDNSIETSVNNNYLNHFAFARMQLLIFNAITLGSDISYNKYDGISDNFYHELFIWNASLGYKFLKNNAAELKISVYDILDKNKSISRNITETYVEDIESNVLRRFLMLSFTYNLRNFNSQEPPKDTRNMPHIPMQNHPRF